MKDSKLAVILSIVAIAGVLSVWLLWILGSLELTVVSLETIVGVIVALLGILVTVILGWQIVNALELRGKIIEMEQIIKNRYVEPRAGHETLKMVR